MTAEDSVTLAQGQNAQSFVIDTIPSVITISAPIRTFNAAITGSVFDIIDASYGIYVTGVSVDGSTTASYT